MKVDWQPDSAHLPTLSAFDLTNLVLRVSSRGHSCFFTHYDMLHESPLCMGIAHDPETVTPFGNVYWVFDGLNGTLMRYDFQEPHGPGSLDHSRASVRRYVDFNLTRVPGIPGHIAVDPADRTVYIADTGGGRVIRLNPDSGHFLRNAKPEFPIYSSTVRCPLALTSTF
eukprot:SAG31_NODE_2205_length_6195_cov_4.592520_4_plen_169_part_00